MYILKLRIYFAKVSESLPLKHNTKYAIHEPMQFRRNEIAKIIMLLKTGIFMYAILNICWHAI